MDGIFNRIKQGYESNRTQNDQRHQALTKIIAIFEKNLYRTVAFQENHWHGMKPDAKAKAKTEAKRKSKTTPDRPG